MTSSRALLFIFSAVLLSKQKEKCNKEINGDDIFLHKGTVCFL